MITHTHSFSSAFSRYYRPRRPKRGNGAPGAALRRLPPSAGIFIVTASRRKRKTRRRRRRRRRPRAPPNASCPCGGRWKRPARRLSSSRLPRTSRPTFASSRRRCKAPPRSRTPSGARSGRTRHSTTHSDARSARSRRDSGQRNEEPSARVPARLGKRYGLIYLGSERCPGCRVFGPLLRAFALRHGIEVLAVSMTGGALEGWPEAVPDAGRAARLGIKARVLPAVVLYDTQTRRAIPVSYGVVAEDQLAERIFALTAREVGSDY